MNHLQDIEMASIISHIVYADVYLKEHPKLTKTQEFMLGVCFPDIRRVSNVPRVKTHNKFNDLDLDFSGLSAFDAGWKFHVWCDLRREELLVQKKFFDIDQVRDCYYFSPYLAEDKLVWGEYKNWETLKNYFLDVEFRDVFDELTEGDWMFWYKLISEYISEAPDRAAMRNFVHSVPSFVSRTELMLEEVEKVLGNKEISQTLFGIHQQLIS